MAGFMAQDDSSHPWAGSTTSTKPSDALVTLPASLRLAPPLFFLSALALYLLPSSRPDLDPSSSSQTRFTPLRGCRGAPTEFRWVLADGGAIPEDGQLFQVNVGQTLRTKVQAFDSQGRKARGSACQSLVVSLHLGGDAHLSKNTSLTDWENGELSVDIEGERAEELDVELLIESPQEGPEQTTQRLLRLLFLPGQGSSYALRVRPVGSSWDRVPPSVNTSGNKWSTNIVFEAILSAVDPFGNQVPTKALLSHISGLEVRGSAGLEFLNPQLEMSEYGQARALFRSARAGKAQLWVPQAGSAKRLAELALEFVEAPVGAAALGSRSLSAEDAEWQPAAEEVRQAFLHAWRGYKRYAWGTDELKPLSRTGRDSFGNIGMTILDSLTTLKLMGLEKEFEEGAEFVEQQLDFDNADREVSVFELTIRALGGLLGAHSLTGRRVFVERAAELAERLLPALNTSSGLPLPYWNIARGGSSEASEPTILAEAGSLQLEFRHLTAVTGDPRFGRAADACFDAIQSIGLTGLVPVQLTPPESAPPRAMNTRYSMGALADSYYEYLLKQWLQSPSEERFKQIWLSVMGQMPALIRPKPEPEKAHKVPKFRLMESLTGGSINYRVEHLACFVPGMIALGLMTVPKKDLMEGRNATWHELAEGLTAGCAELWTSTKTGLAPEFAFIKDRHPYNIDRIPSGGKFSFLRPETAESIFYMYRLTGQSKYRKLGKKLFDAIIAHAKVDAGFASVADVTRLPSDRMDDMQSFVMAETFKYLFLLFSPNEVLDLDKYVLNTEAHPLRRAGPIP